MSKNTKIILIVLGVLAAISILCCGGFGLIGYFGAKDGIAALQEGQQFGHSATEQDCQEASWVRASKCGPTDISCPVAAENFFKGCLSTATATAGFCDDMPQADGVFEAGMMAAEFGQNTCANLGSSPWRPRDESLRPSQQACVRVLQARVIDCNSENLAKNFE